MNAVPRIQVFQCPQCHALYPVDQWNVQKGRCNACAGNKYGNKKVKVGGRTYDSIDEYNRWRELEWRVQAGEIEHLRFHPKFDIVVEGVKVGRMTLDSAYVIRATQEHIWEDVKGGEATKTQAYKLRKKLVEVLYKIVITEFVY